MPKNASIDRNSVALAEAPGWEKFLGGTSKTIQFTSEEVNKLKQQRRQHHDASSPVVAPPKPPPKPRFNPMREDATDNAAVTNNNHNANIGLAPIHGSKSSPSLNQPQLMASPSAAASKKPHHLRNVSASAHSSPWKNSLDSLNNRASAVDNCGSPISRGFTTTASAADNKSPRQTQELHWKESASSAGHHHHHHHHHSNSDSGLSSLSGRTSTMSPISTMSTVSSVSSNSSSGSSSRASLRSASIVSSCTIPLDEEDEEAAHSAHSAHSSPSGTFKHLQQQQQQNGSSRRGGRRVPPPPPSTTSVASPPSSSSCAAGKLPEELECDEMARELMERLRPGDAGCKKLTSLFGESTRFFCLPSVRSPHNGTELPPVNCAPLHHKSMTQQCGSFPLAATLSASLFCSLACQ